MILLQDDGLHQNGQKRMKCLKFADTERWDVALACMFDDLASDTEDEKRIKRVCRIQNTNYTTVATRPFLRNTRLLRGANLPGSIVIFATRITDQGIPHTRVRNGNINVH